MKKIIFGIFAHPDDEAFACAGTLLTESKNGSDVHLVTLTLGDAGVNRDDHDDIAAIREREWRRSGELIGAKSLHYLGYDDGCLCNQTMIDATKKLIDHVTSIMDAASTDSAIEFIAFDFNGISGHIDHIVASRAAAQVFYTLKARDSRFTKLRLVCLPETRQAEHSTDWIYMEAGRAKSEITEIVDARHYHDEIIEIIRTHHSQRGDGEYHINAYGADIGLNYFIVKE